MVQTTAYVTAPLGFVPFRSSNSTDDTGMLAAALAAAPVVLLYVLMQRQVIGTFATTGSKG